MLVNDREVKPPLRQSFRFRSPRDEPPVGVEEYLEGPPPPPHRHGDDE